MLRSEDTRGGFEAKADMLSITGMTLEQFAALMQGLGYKAEKAEREKVKPVDQALAEAPADAAQAADETPVETAEDAVEAIVDEGEAPIAAEPQPEAEVTADIPETPEEEVIPGETPEMAEPEIEVYYTFTWAPRAPRGNRPAQGGRGKPQGKPKGKGGPKSKPREESTRNFSSKPEKKDKIDPDNPFAAALMGLKTKG
jgi:ATP-dependent RNA helicase SUPV3L1/SUV3